jgi:hypothetical protein
MATLGWPAVEDMLMRWFDSATKPHVHRPYGENATILRGLLWCCAPQAGETLIRSIGRLADAMFKKIPDIGPRSPKVGNACLYVTTQHQHVDLERAAAYHT